MQEGKLTFRDIFDGDKLFEIPEYQRAYSSGNKQIEEYLEDLKNQPSNKPYNYSCPLFSISLRNKATPSLILVEVMLEANLRISGFAFATATPIPDC